VSVLEFIQVLVSIILALGIAELLKGWAELIRAESVKSNPVVLAFGAWLGLAHLQFWWSGWRFRVAESWAFPELVLYVTPPVILYLTARILVPQTVEGADLVSYYRRIGPTLWRLVAALYVSFILTNTLLLGVPLLSAGPFSQFTVAVVALVASRVDRSSVHWLAIFLLMLQLAWRATQVSVALG